MWDPLSFVTFSPIWKRETRKKTNLCCGVQGKTTMFRESLPSGCPINRVNQEVNKMAFLLQNLSLCTWKGAFL